MEWKQVQGPPREVHELRRGDVVLARVQFNGFGWSAHVYDPNSRETVANSAHPSLDVARDWVASVLLTPTPSPKRAVA